MLYGQSRLEKRPAAIPQLHKADRWFEAFFPALPFKTPKAADVALAAKRRIDGRPDHRLPHPSARIPCGVRWGSPLVDQTSALFL